MKYSYSIFFILLMVSGCSNATSTNEPLDSEMITATQQDSYQKAKKYSEAGDKENYLKFLEISANSGDEIAQNELAGLYAFGDSIPKNGKKFIYWSELAASKGYTLAQLNLGTAYFFGNNGVTQDLAKAEKWLTLAASNNEEIAKNYLQQIKNNEIPDPSIPDDIKILMQNDK
ncbi:sel1 repeat family protein [Acinetobacter bereziniae]|uniref:tetratricopeptide repeat protein n=1 Tax=Acinetobacter bereziniae TaxID=106648 RepID=UPI001900A4BF|nr:SEL1-like repeat protein [Acinetobacter bereziniae]MBJ8451807.1 sel1 repeat family protein [Acinetobacter bereziniae]MBJ8455997.1 sel1 repeat family protein [Acinetobacter bereziniae]